ncbi:MAG: asparagine--tRNA ligase [Thermoplasmata archaeon]
MSPPVPIREAFQPDAIGRELTVRGWLVRGRSSGGILFLLIRDRTGLLQITGRKEALGEEGYRTAEHIQVEGAFSATGTIAEDRRAPGGRELRAARIDTIDAGAPFPILKEQTEEFLLDQRHLAIRSPELVAMFRIKAGLLKAFRAFFEGEELLEVTPPILTGNAAEGGSEAFQLDYFGRPGYLSQTAQLYLEAMLPPHERVYALTPSFRAEKSRTPRHLTEFQHLEIELAWVDLDGLLDFIERMMVFVFHEVARAYPTELERLGRAPEELAAIQAPFPRISYEAAVEELARQGFPVRFGSDLGTAEERALTLASPQPRFITRFPADLKAFYMLRSPGDPRTVEAADLLGPEGYGELVGASARETDLGRLETRIRAVGADPKEYAWYLDLRRHGNIPHAGFGLGVERVLRFIGRREHIRDTTPFPRTPSRHTP